MPTGLLEALKFWWQLQPEAPFILLTLATSWRSRTGWAVLTSVLSWEIFSQIKNASKWNLGGRGFDGKRSSLFLPRHGKLTGYRSSHEQHENVQLEKTCAKEMCKTRKDHLSKEPESERTRGQDRRSGKLLLEPFTHRVFLPILVCNCPLESPEIQKPGRTATIDTWSRC